MDRFNARVFLAVAETGSFRKAAENLGYTQAGISYIVSSMEDEMGLCLFIRIRSGVRLSPEGEALMPLVRRYLVWERDLHQMVDDLNGLERGSLRIQIFDSISVHWIPGIIKEFRDRYPAVSIDLISEEDSVRQEEMVSSGEVDCGFFLTDVRSELDVFPLIRENLMAVVAPDHPLAGMDRFPISELGNYPYIGMKYDDHTGIGKIFTDHGVQPEIAYCMDNDYAAMAMVGKGLGYLISPELLLRTMPYELRCMQFDEPQTRTISIGTRSMNSCSRACKRFIEYTREWVRKNG